MTDTGYQGGMRPDNSLGEYNAMVLLIWEVLSRVNTITLAEVVSVTNSGGVAAVGFVDLQPLVNQLDGNQKSVPHGVLHNIPYMRIQGGANAIILDPEVGDIGMVAFASRDISTVKSTKVQANPGSGRMFNMADGLYLGGMLNGVPTQYVRFTDSGMDITAPNGLTINANVNVNGTVAATGDVTAGSISLETHVHSGVTGGTSNTGAPV